MNGPWPSFKGGRDPLNNSARRSLVKTPVAGEKATREPTLQARLGSTGGVACGASDSERSHGEKYPLCVGGSVRTIRGFLCRRKFIRKKRKEKKRYIDFQFLILKNNSRHPFETCNYYNIVFLLDYMQYSLYTQDSSLLLNPFTIDA